MTAARKLNLIDVDDYLEGELVSAVKHEYVGGVVYAMAGGRNTHNTISVSFVSLLYAQLRGKPCQVFNSDTKLRIRTLKQTRFYYPDGMIVCRPNAGSDTFQDNPVIVAEVVSPSTRRTDGGEKKDAYLALPTLTAYVMIETTQPRVVVHRRGGDGAFIAEVYDGIDAVIPFEDVGCSLRLSELYDRVDFTAAEAEDAVEEEEFTR